MRGWRAIAEIGSTEINELLYHSASVIRDHGDVDDPTNGKIRHGPQH